MLCLVCISLLNTSKPHHDVTVHSEVVLITIPLSWASLGSCLEHAYFFEVDLVTGCNFFHSHSTINSSLDVDRAYASFATHGIFKLILDGDVKIISLCNGL